MRIWFDADNGPHVLILRPLATELKLRGHDVIFTSRDRASTCELLDLYRIPHTTFGSTVPRGAVFKALATVRRAIQLIRFALKARPDASFAHGSRALPIASRISGVPNATMYDYEWVNPTIFNLFSSRILLPSCITPERAANAGIQTRKVVFYNGLKEELYLASATFENLPAHELGLSSSEINVLLRPPAVTAHYHNPHADQLLLALLDRLSAERNVRVVLLPRSREQREIAERLLGGRLITPEKVFDGPSLIASMDAVFSGGGTMTREAAVLGVPAYSFFRGREGSVDEWLERHSMLVMLRTASDIQEKVRLQKRESRNAKYRINPDLVKEIADVIERLAAPSQEDQQ